MRIIKPGKIGPITEYKSKKGKKKSDSSDFERSILKTEIWEDYNPNKKNKKKKEYTKGSGNRMLPVEEKEEDSTRTVLQNEISSDVKEHEPSSDFEKLEESLGYSFKSRELLLMSLTHRSSVPMADRADYERLEFLGDALLDLVIAHLLSDFHPEAREGELSKMRAALVNTQALAKVARELGLGDYIRLGKGEYATNGHKRASILADVMEAIVGAMYRDSNYEESFKVIEKIFREDLSKVIPYDPKTDFQEVLHIAGSEPPSYLLERVEGPEHAPTFVTIVVVDGEICGRGKSQTKKGSQQEAAAEAMSRMDATCENLELKEGQNLIVPECLLTYSISNSCHLLGLDGVK